MMTPRLTVVLAVCLSACTAAVAPPEPDGTGEDDQFIRRADAGSFDYKVTKGSCVLQWSTPGASALEALPDVDRDGVKDVVAVRGQHVIEILSGRTGAVLGRHAVNVAAIGEVVVVADADGDGVPDLAIGSPPQPNPPVCDDAGSCGAPVGYLDNGKVVVISSQTGRVIWSKKGTASAQIGSVLGADRDENGVVVGAGLDFQAGALSVLSASDGTVIRTVATPADATAFYPARSFAADLDHDGTAEVITADPGGPHGTYAGDVLVSRAHGPLASLFAAPASDFLGDEIVVAGDLNRDGVDDLLVGAHNHFSELLGESVGRVYAVNGKTGAELWHLDGLRPSESLGVVASSVDLDGDGIAEVLIGTTAIGANVPMQGQSGRIALINGKTGATLAGIQSMISADQFSNGFGAGIVSLGKHGANRVSFVVSAPDWPAGAAVRTGLVTAWSCGK